MAFHWWIRTFATIFVNRWRGSLLNSPYKDIAKFFALIVKAMGMRILYARNNIVDDGGCHTWKNAYLVHFWGVITKEIIYNPLSRLKVIQHTPLLLSFYFYLCIWPDKKFLCAQSRRGAHQVPQFLTWFILSRSFSNFPRNYWACLFSFCKVDIIQ